MDQEEALAVTLRRALVLLSGLKVKFHITGGLISAFYGEPRLTQDIDIVIGLSGNEDLVRSLISAFSRDFIIDPESSLNIALSGGMFQALDPETFIKIDFHAGVSVPGELERSSIRELLPGLAVPVVSREDSILSKLLWIKKGSHKSRQDVIMMLKQRDLIDFQTLEHRARDLGVQDLLDELNREAS